MADLWYQVGSDSDLNTSDKIASSIMIVIVEVLIEGYEYLYCVVRLYNKNDPFCPGWLVPTFNSATTRCPEAQKLNRTWYAQDPNGADELAGVLLLSIHFVV